MVCTELRTGDPVYHKCRTGNGEDLKWMQASASMPLLSRIVEIGGRKLLDGGIGDSVALKFMQKRGYGRNVVILTQPKGYEKKPNSMLPLFKVIYRRYPEFIKAVANRHIRYNEMVKYIEQQEALGRAFVIRPPEALNIGRMEKDPEKLQSVYDLGRETALKAADRIKELGFCRT